jgi:Putative auto-transporter adhesin, head GIN domain
MLFRYILAIALLVSGVFFEVSSGYADNCDPDCKSITLSTKGVELVGVVGDVSVRVHDAPSTIVTLVGDGSLHRYFDIHQSKESITIQQKPEHYRKFVNTNGGISIIVGGHFSNTVVIGNEVIISGAEKSADWKLSILVPKRQPIKIRGAVSSVSIGDTEGPVDAEIAGAGRVIAGRIGSSRFGSAGSAVFEVDAVEGDLHVHMVGGGKMIVRDGEIGRLRIALQGAGHAEIGGTVKEADLSIVGAGSVKIDRIKRKPAISVLGAGDVDYTLAK